MMQASFPINPNAYQAMDDTSLYFRVSGRINPSILWDCIYLTNNDPRNYRTVPFNFVDARKLLAMSDGTPKGETDKLLEYFWGYAPQLDAPKILSPTYSTAGAPIPIIYGTPGSSCILTGIPDSCAHEWHEVILFNAPHLRCVHCDIKKTSVEEGK